MQSGSLALIDELEVAIASGTSESRVAALHQVTNLFLSAANPGAPEQIELFDEVIGRLAADIETKARAELARRLAPSDKAPVRVLHSLASDDDISVAGPILTNSTCLDENFLLESATKRSQEHLLAISQRRALSPVLTDALVTRGDQKVVRTLAENEGATFSESGFSTLVKKSADDDVLAVSVGLRVDLPTHHFDKVIAQASKAVLEKLSAANPQLGTQIQDVIAKIASDVRDAAAPAPRDYSGALTRLTALHAAGKLSQTELAIIAKAGKVEETVAALSLLCKLPIEAGEKLLFGEQLDPLIILGRASEFSWLTVRAIIGLRQMHAKTPLEDLEPVEQTYKKLNLGTAQRIMRFYKVRLAVVKSD